MAYGMREEGVRGEGGGMAYGMRGEGVWGEGGGSHGVREHYDTEISARKHCGHGDMIANTHLHATPTTPAVPA